MFRVVNTQRITKLLEEKKADKALNLKNWSPEEREKALHERKLLERFQEENAMFQLVRVGDDDFLQVLTDDSILQRILRGNQCSSRDSSEVVEESADRMEDRANELLKYATKIVKYEAPLPAETQNNL